MTIAVGADHAGFALKQSLVSHLESSGYKVTDVGTHNSDSVDYTDFAEQVAKAISAGKVQRGVLVCGSAIGMCIAANRYEGVRAVVLRDKFDARLSREHNDTNVACFGARVTKEKNALKLLNLWLTTEFEGGRHARRVEKIDKKEK